MLEKMEDIKRERRKKLYEKFINAGRRVLMTIKIKKMKDYVMN